MLVNIFGPLMKLDINRLRIWRTSIAIWVWLCLSIPAFAARYISEPAPAQATGNSNSQSGFQALFKLDSLLDRESFRNVFSNPYLSESPTLTRTVDRTVLPHPDPRSPRAWFVHQRYQVTSASISLRGRRLSSRQNSKSFRSFFVDQSFCKPSFSITPRDPSFIARTSECFLLGLSLGGCGQ